MQMTPQKTFPDNGFVRLPQILEVFPVSRSSWWAGVKSGRYPASFKLAKRTTAWRVEDIEALLSSLEQGENNV
ncbi:AlpA Predicted transcriptional regulator [Methylophilaceae bacterium]